MNSVSGPPPRPVQALGLNVTQFNRHVILETNNATERVFPEVGAPRHRRRCCVVYPGVPSTSARRRLMRPPSPSQHTRPSSAVCLLSSLPPCSPQVPDIEAPGFWDRMERMKDYNLRVQTSFQPASSQHGGSGGPSTSGGGGGPRRRLAAAQERRAPARRAPHPTLQPACWQATYLRHTHLPLPLLVLQIIAIEKSDAPDFLKKLQKAPLVERIVAE